MRPYADILSDCRLLLHAYRSGLLWTTTMPEDTSPTFSTEQYETRLAYFTLPMSLNYQRDSYKLREAALRTFDDTQTRVVFDVEASARLDTETLRTFLMEYKVALHPNKHIATRSTIAKTITEHRWTISGLLAAAEYDFLKLRDIVQKHYKSGFPYLSGPKIFNYRSFILQEYGTVPLKNSEWIDIAPDTHVTKCSVLLGVITQEEAIALSKEQISARRRELLHGTDITPITMHPPLWFWSKNGFLYRLP